jgi:hypothetical protein
MQDDGGDVLGNLPRSRPGRRSEKRTGGTAKRSTAAKGSGAAKRSTGTKRSTAAKKPARAKASAKAAATAGKSSAAKKPAAKRQAAGAKSAPPQQAAPRSAQGGNPVEDAVRAATKVAETGLRVASGVTREVLRRLPRP